MANAAWKICRSPHRDNAWNAFRGTECVAGIRVDREGPAQLLTIWFPASPKLNWSWRYETVDAAMHGGHAYVRGIERAVQVHGEETRA